MNPSKAEAIHPEGTRSLETSLSNIIIIFKKGEKIFKKWRLRERVLQESSDAAVHFSIMQYDLNFLITSLIN